MIRETCSTATKAILIAWLGCPRAILMTWRLSLALKGSFAGWGVRDPTTAAGYEANPRWPHFPQRHQCAVPHNRQSQNVNCFGKHHPQNKESAGQPVLLTVW